MFTLTWLVHTYKAHSVGLEAGQLTFFFSVFLTTRNNSPSTHSAAKCSAKVKSSCHHRSRPFYDGRHMGCRWRANGSKGRPPYCIEQGPGLSPPTVIFSIVGRPMIGQKSVGPGCTVLRIPLRTCIPGRSWSTGAPLSNPGDRSPPPLARHDATRKKARLGYMRDCSVVPASNADCVSFDSTATLNFQQDAVPGLRAALGTSWRGMMAVGVP